MKRFPLVYWVIAGALGLIFVMRVNSCRDNDQSKKGAVMKERMRVQDSVIAATLNSLATAQQQLGMALANGTKIVDRWHESAPRPIPTGTPHDSITHLTQQVRECRDIGDSLVTSVVLLRSTCTAFRDTATKAIASYKLGLAQRDSLLKIGKPPKRWNIGPYIGWGLTSDSAFAIRRGFSAGIALTYSIIRW